MPLFKIRDASGESKFVIAASSLEELKIKGIYVDSVYKIVQFQMFCCIRTRLYVCVFNK